MYVGFAAATLSVSSLDIYFSENGSLTAVFVLSGIAELSSVESENRVIE